MPDDDGFDVFVAARHHALVRTPFLLVGDRGHAEDVVQTALYKTYCHWHRLRSKDAAEAYTRRTLTRLAGRMAQRGWRREAVVAQPQVPDGVDPAHASAAALDMHAALGALPWPQRAVLVLRYSADLSEAETAAALNCSPGTVKSRASRGLQTLREQLGTTLEPYEDGVQHG